MQNMSTACSSAEALYFKIARFNTRSIIWLLSQAHAFENDSFLRNGRHGGVQHVQQKKSEYEIFMKREKIYLTFTFKGWFSSAILNFLFENQTNCYWWFEFYHMLITMTMIMAPENGFSSAQIKKPRPLFHANIPPKWWSRCLFYSFTTFGRVIGKFWILNILSSF